MLTRLTSHVAKMLMQPLVKSVNPFSQRSNDAELACSSVLRATRINSMNNSNTSKMKVPPQGVLKTERRRIAKFGRDSRGNVTVEWHVAPEGYERLVLEIVQDSPRAAEFELGVNPYDRDECLQVKGRAADRPPQAIPWRD